MNSDALVRVTGVVVAFAAAGVLVVGCSQAKDTATGALSSASSAASAAASAAQSAGSAASSAVSSVVAAPTSTQIAGKNGTQYVVQGPILAKWSTLNGDQKNDLGAPYDEQKETLDKTGVYQQFDGGVLIHRNDGPVYMVWGKIRDEWNANQASQGKLGYPTADEQALPDGSYKSTFDHGVITFKPGDDAAVVTMN